MKILDNFDWYEVVLSNSKNIKFLYTSFDIEKRNIIKNYILNYLSNIDFIKEYDIKKIDKIFRLFDWIEKSYFHFWIDNKSGRYKIYTTLYNLEINKSLELIKKIQEILWISSIYNLEPDIIWFDCLWFDLSDNLIDMKVYELVELKNNFDGLPSYISKDDIREIGYLKAFSWRKKKFFRFWKLYDIELFKDDFDLSLVDSTTKNNFTWLKKKVKYYCYEWDKKEIYFI